MGGRIVEEKRQLVNFEGKREIIRVKKNNSRGDAEAQRKNKGIDSSLSVSASLRENEEDFSCFKTIGRGSACGIGRGADGRTC